MDGHEELMEHFRGTPGGTYPLYTHGRTDSVITVLIVELRGVTQLSESTQRIASKVDVKNLPLAAPMAEFRNIPSVLFYK